MPIVTIKELKEEILRRQEEGARGLRLMGIDQSKNAFGLALSNPELTMATPLQTIKRTKFAADLKKLSALCKEYSVAGFIIGLPLHMDGAEGPRTDSVRHFAQNLIAGKETLGFDPWIAFYDERLTTFAADDALNAAGSRKKDGAKDSVAAQIMLTEVLARMASASCKA